MASPRAAHAGAPCPARRSCGFRPARAGRTRRVRCRHRARRPARTAPSAVRCSGALLGEPDDVVVLVLVLVLVLGAGDGSALLRHAIAPLLAESWRARYPCAQGTTQPRRRK